LGDLDHNVAKNFWNTHKFSDVELVVSNGSYQAHKVLLAASSPLLSKMLQENTNNAKLVIPVESKNESELFIMMLQYIYSGQISMVTLDQVTPLLSMAHKYGLRPLKEQCGYILAQNVNADNAFEFLRIAKEFAGIESLQTACAHFISKNFKELVQDKHHSLLKLDVYTFKKMLENNELNVRTEREVFDAVVKYVSQYDNKASREDVLTTLLPSIRFNLIPLKHLIEVVEIHPVVKDHPLLKKLLYETYRYKVMPSMKPPYTTRHRKGMSIQYEFSTDKKGPNVTISTDKRTATNTLGTYVVAHSSDFDDDGIWIFRLKVNNSSYCGIGVVDETLNSYTREFHNQPGCYVYYMSGPGYSNGVSDGSIEGFATGDTVTVILNMEEKSFKLVKKEE